MNRVLILAALAACVITTSLAAQGGRQPSPDGTAAAQVGGKFVAGSENPVYQGGKWIEILYGRPLKRGRDLWGSGADYGKKLYDGAPVWRAGANVSTRLKSEVPLVIGGKTVPAGEHTMFIDLKPNNHRTELGATSSKARWKRRFWETRTPASGKPSGHTEYTECPRHTAWTSAWTNRCVHASTYTHPSKGGRVAQPQWGGMKGE